MNTFKSVKIANYIRISTNVLFLFFLLAFGNVLNAADINTEDINTNIPGVGKSEIWGSNSIITALSITDGSGKAYFNENNNQQIFPKDGEVVKVRIDWSLFKGDYNDPSIDLSGEGKFDNPTRFFYYKLPDFFKFEGSLDISERIKMNVDGGTVDIGEYKIELDGDHKPWFKIIFNKEPGYHIGVQGYFEFDAKVKLPDSGNETIKVPGADGKTIDIIITPYQPGPDETKISKSGQVTDDGILWTITATPQGDCTDLKITDNPGNNGKPFTLKTDNVIVQLEEEDLIKGTDYNITSEGVISFKLGGKISDWNDLKGKEITVDIPATPATGVTSGTFYNSATITSSGGINKTSNLAHVTIEAVKVEKSYIAYDPNSKTISWEIKYNTANKVIAEGNAWIADKLLGGKQTFDENSIKVYRIDGSAVGDTIELSKDNGYTFNLVQAQINNDSLYIKLYADDTDWHVTKQYIIRYSSVLKLTEVEEIVEASAGNKVTVFEGIGVESSYTSPGALSKDLGTINYADTTVVWTISLNKVKYDIKKDWILTDQLGEGLTLLKNVDIVFQDVSTRKVLTENTDYLIEIDGQVITIKPKQESGHFATEDNGKHEYSVTIKTKWDYKVLAKKNGTEFVNNAKLVFSGCTLEVSKPFKPKDLILKNGEKTGSYDAQTKELTWKVILNPNGVKFETPIFTDTLKNHQKYVEESLKVYKLKLEQGGTIDKTATEAQPLSNYTLEQTTSDIGDVLNLHFNKSIDYGLYIVFKTTLKDTLITQETYINTAVLDNTLTGGGSDDRITETGKVKIPKGNVFIEKQGQYAEGYNNEQRDNDFVFWKLVINPNGSKMENVIVKDSLSAEEATVRLDAESIKLYRVGIKTDGTLDEANKSLVSPEDNLYTLTTEGNEFKLTFNGIINDAYLLYYKSYVELDSEDAKINNKATINDSKSINIPTDKPIIIEVNTYNSGASGGTRSSFTINKVRKGTSYLLPGAIFKIYKDPGVGNEEDKIPTNIDALVFLKEETTSLEKETLGTITLKLKPGTYWLYEVQAPSGYLLPSEEDRWTRFTYVNGGKTEVIVENTPDGVPSNYLKVNLPPVDFKCVSTDPVAGSYFVEEGECFSFSFIYEDCCELPYAFTPVIKANGVDIRPTADGVYTICDIREQQDIEIVPNDKPTTNPVGNEAFEANTARVWSNNKKVYLYSPESTRASVYSVTGQLQAVVELQADETKELELNAGVYVVKINGLIRKLVNK